MIPATARRLRCERGQTSAEYIGMVLVVVAIVAAIAVTGVGGTITQRIEDAICSLVGRGCGDPQVAHERCRTRSSTSTNKITAGLSVRLFAGGAGGERVIIKEQFDDRTARYTITDEGSLEAVLAGRGGSLGVGGIGGSLTASLAAAGVLQDARIFETSSAEQTQEIERALKSSGGLEGVARGVENALDVPGDLLTENLPLGLGFSISDHVDVDGFVLDRILGSEELPEPTSVAIGGELAAIGNAGARSDRGPEELEAGGKLRAAAGALQYTSGPRAGEREFYYQVSGDAGAELKSELLGAGNAGVDGELSLTLVLGADGLPRTLRVDGTGTAAGLNDLGRPDVGISAADLREFAIDRDLAAGQTIEFTGELDLRDRGLRDAALDILRAGPGAGTAAAGLSLAGEIGGRAKIEYGVYDASRRQDTTNTDLVVVSLSTEDSEQVNTLRSLYRKPSGGVFERIDCNG